MGNVRLITETYPRGNRAAAGESVPGLSIPDHDRIEMTYTAGNLTGVKYFATAAKATGQDLRAELVLEYDGGGNLTSVSRVI